jgi:hypothetical protein
MVNETIRHVRKMSNKDLLHFVNKDKKERREGAGRFVTTRQFFGRDGAKELRTELKRRQESGKISKSAGKSKRSGGRGFNPMDLLGF